MPIPFSRVVPVVRSANINKPGLLSNLPAHQSAPPLTLGIESPVSTSRQFRFGSARASHLQDLSVGLWYSPTQQVQLAELWGTTEVAAFIGITKNAVHDGFLLFPSVASLRRTPARYSHSSSVPAGHLNGTLLIFVAYIVTR